MNFSRKTILVVGAALLAACGDKVVVAPPITPIPPVPKVNFVEVTPATATVNTGAVITFTAAVNADVGLATTVTWSASAGAITTAGVFTAPATANPGVSVCATSTVDTGKKNCASVVVQGVTTPATIPATVSIASITAGGTFFPVNPSAVAGQIDVTLNIAPGNQTISKVEVLLGGIVAYTQSFSAAQSAALRFAVDEAVAAQSTFPQIVASINTACYQGGGSATCDAYVAGDATGAPVWLNGAKQLQAKVYVGAATASASVAQNITLANVDGFHLTTSGGTSAVDGAGYRWTGNGSLTVNAWPVMYSGSSVGTVAATLAGNGACPAVGAIGTATAATAGAYVITGALAGVQSPAGCTTTSPNLINVTSTNSAGDNLTLVVTGVLNAQTGLRWDNVAPATAGLVANPNGRANGWINDAVVFNAINAVAAPNNWIAAAVTDAGIGGTIAYSVRVGTTYTLAKAAAGLTNATSLDVGTAGSATNLSYCAIAYTADLLGNTTGNPGGTCAAPAAVAGVYVLPVAGVAAQNFGVDRANPTIAYTALAIAVNSRRSAGTVAGEYIVTVNDTGLVGNSGMLPTAPVKMTLSRRAMGTTANTAGTTTLFDATGATVATGLTATGVAVATPLYSTAFTGVTGAANHAYWTHNATAYDAAGNSASVSPRTMVYDATAAVPGAPLAPLTITALGYSASAFINEDLDIQDYAFNGTYTGAPVIAPATIGMPWVAVNGFNAATFANTNYQVTTAVNLPLAIQANMGAGLTNIANLSTIARSQTYLGVTSGVSAFATVTPGAAITFTNMTAFNAVTLPAGGVTGIVTGNTTVAAATTPASAALTITATGTTAIFNNPFTRIDFYMLDASGLRYVLVGSATTPVLNDNGAVRTFSWTATVTGTTLYTTLNGAGATWASQIVALGMNASGQVGMVNAALTGVNVVF